MVPNLYTGRVLRTIVLASSLLFGVCAAHAQFGVAWPSSPRVVVIASSPTDERLALVDDAIVFWNAQLQQAGSAFRLAPAERVIQEPPDAALAEQAQLIQDGVARFGNIPPALRELPGDLRIVLGNRAFVSHAGPFDERHTRTVGIRVVQGFFALPNVARNVVAHEIGHAIGLGHNADPAALMCGRPAPCRPDAFQSAQPRSFPLLPQEQAQLLRLYPADWRPRQP